jgi:hypothetical protein
MPRQYSRQTAGASLAAPSKNYYRHKTTNKRKKRRHNEWRRRGRPHAILGRLFL